jgi:hypothetical protein
MGTAPSHLGWLVNTGEKIKTACGKAVEVWELNHKEDPAVLSAWAKHFRAHYASDAKADALRGKKSRKEFFENIKFPSKTSNLGPPTRAGDFAEILLSDYLEWKLGYWVPRERWNSKPTLDESVKGCDVVGFKIFDATKATSKDVLAVLESKAALTKHEGSRLQDAVNDSAKDHLRIDESLNYLRQRLLEQGLTADADRVERFQSPVDMPYKESYAAAALVAAEHFDAKILATTDSIKLPGKKNPGKGHPNASDLTMIVIRGPALMDLVHELYRRAADEA